MRKYLLLIVLAFFILPLRAQEESFLDLYDQYLKIFGTQKIYDSNIEKIKGNEDKILKYDSKTFHIYKDSIDANLIQRVSIDFTKELDLQEVFNDLAIFPNLFYLKLENQNLFSRPIDLKFPKDLSGISGVGFINFYGNFSWDFNIIFMQLQELKNLKYIALINFGEDDALAENISLLSSLEGLSLSGRFGAGIPDAVSKLQNLKSLAFSADLFPDFHEQVGKFKNNANLKEVYLNSFNLGEEDYSIFKEFTSIERLELHNVEVPNLDEFLKNSSGNKNLKHLEIFGTKTSNFSTGLNNFEKLKYLRLERIGDGIIVPQEIYNLKDLENLIISDNKTFTHLDKSIKNLINLKKLTIYFSNLQNIPPEIGELSRLEELNLKHNSIDKLPDEITRLTSLTKFYIDNNRLEILPTEIGNLKNLQEIHLQHNLLKELPVSFSNLEYLELLHLEANDLKNLPKDFGKLSSLEHLNLSKNLLQDLTESFGNLSSLKILYLDNNDLKKLPDNIGQLSQLKSIYLNNHQNNNIGTYNTSTSEFNKDSSRIERKNNAIGYLPTGFSQLGNLKTVWLENNPIDAPALFDILKDLKSEKYHVDLNNCGINELPESGWENIQIESLYLRNNQIKTLPRNIMNAPYLKILNLSNNPVGELSRYYSNKEQLIIAFYEAGFIDRSDLPKNESIAQALLKIGYNKKEQSKRLEFFEHAFTVDPVFTDNKIRASDYAEALLSAGNFQKAINYFDRAIAQDTARGPYILNFILPNFKNRAVAHLAVGDTLAAIRGLEYASQRFSSGDWTKAALLARNLGKDSLASGYFKKGEQFYRDYIQNNLEADRVDYGYQLSLLELYIVEEDLKKASNYHEQLKGEEISEKDKQLLLEYLGQVVAILQDKEKEEDLKALKAKNLEAKLKITSWSFDLLKTWLELTNLDKTKVDKIRSLTMAMENKG